MHKRILLVFCVTLTAAAHEPEAQRPFEHAHAHESLLAHIHAGWESRYFSEGRDSLDGDSLRVTSIELGWRHFTGGVWYGSSPDQIYDELQLTLGVSESVGDCDVYLAYTHLQFPTDDSHDDEIGIGGLWSGLPMDFKLSTDAYYSFDARGTFFEAALQRTFEVTRQLTLEGSGVLGINQGYVTDGHDGANHFALRGGAEHRLTPSLSLAGHAAYSWAIDRDTTLAGDQNLINFFHASVGLQWSF